MRGQAALNAEMRLRKARAAEEETARLRDAATEHTRLKGRGQWEESSLDKARLVRQVVYLQASQSQPPNSISSGGGARIPPRQTTADILAEEESARRKDLAGKKEAAAVRRQELAARARDVAMEREARRAQQVQEASDRQFAESCDEVRTVRLQRGAERAAVTWQEQIEERAKAVAAGAAAQREAEAEEARHLAVLEKRYLKARRDCESNRLRGSSNRVLPLIYAQVSISGLHSMMKT
jgi:hypothetical protein